MLLPIKFTGLVKAIAFIKIYGPLFTMLEQ